MYYLIEPTVFSALESAQRDGLAPTAEQRERFMSQEMALGGGKPATSGSAATIRVEGVLTKRPDILSFLFGGGNVTFASILDQLDAIEADSSIKQASMLVDSPGGEVDGLFEVLSRLQGFSKPINVRAAKACSAAFAIAAAAGKIEATNPAATFGSIGVATRFQIPERAVDIINTSSPDKRPDVSTNEGQAVVRKHLDAIHELFVEAIAAGRGTPPSVVNKDFGRGGSVLAGEAKRLGMIDSIAKPKSLRSASQLAARTMAVAADARAGRIKKGVNESERDFAWRLAAIARGEPEAVAEAPKVDLGDIVADALEGRRCDTAPAPPYVRLTNGDLGDEVAARMAQRRGK